MGKEIELYEHQLEARRRMMMNKSYALFMEQGTGKTLPVLFHLSYLFKHGLIKNAIIIAPKSALGAWTRDIEKLPDSVREEIDMDNLTIVNYDIIHRREEYVDGTFGCIILDESQMIKTPSSKRSKAVRKMGKKATYKYILTGTPIANSKLHEFWSQYDFLNPSIFGTYTNFKKQYCRLDQWFQPYAYMNTEQLECIVNSHAFRITKEECLDLPDVLDDVVVKVPMRERKIYKQAVANLITEGGVDMEIDNSLVKLLRLRQICNGFLQDEEQLVELKCDKLSYMSEILDSRKGLKTVIFATFKQSIKMIKDELDKQGYKYMVLDGDQPDKQIWKEFQADDTMEVIICQYQTANAGIDLFSADAIIFYEPHLSSSINSQARDRIHRIGQKRTVTYYYLITEKSVEEKIYKTITDGSDFTKEILRDYVRGENK